MNVLSLFDGISCARVSLDRAGIEVNCYLASEIEKNAIKISEKNYPDIIHVGSVVDLEVEGQIDLLIGGSPCQDLSIAKKDRKGLGGDRSGLFWEYVRLMKECKPQWFILENVASMPKADRDIITKEMGVEPVMFNASLVSAQSRKRLFWTNIPFELPEDRGILLKDILQPDGEVDERMVMKGKAYCLTASYSHQTPTENGIKNSIERKHRTMVKVGHIGGSDAQANRVYDTDGKSCTLSANGGGLGAKTGLYQSNDRIRKLTPIECERLQGLPDNYTEGVATTHRYKCLGNAFNVDVVAHILGRIKLMY
jgi:DNA (cytosine-5)-methyltransferase 3A